MNRHAGKNGRSRPRAAAILFVLLASACGQTTLANPTASAGARPIVSTASAPSSSPNEESGTVERAMIVRISEIRIAAAYLEEYKAILKEEAEASVRLEPGVISIFPMYQKENPTEIRILEIYASRDAYEAHLKTPHFQRYKTTTLKMVESLKLVDMEALDAEAMAQIFMKMGKR
jgi:quinol monooxygenase YgiN